MNKRSRREHLASLKAEPRTMVFYEAPHKLPYTLADLLEALGDRRIALVRELTKIHEEVVRTTLAEAAARYREERPGGFVVVVEGAAPPQAPPASPEDGAALAGAYVREGLSPSEAAKRAGGRDRAEKGRYLPPVDGIAAPGAPAERKDKI